MKKLFLSTLLCLFLATNALALRIVVLYAAASPILKSLGISPKEVVGVTRTDHTFPSAVKVGSHLHPNIELVKALHPDLIIAGSKRAFPPELEKRLGIKVFRYDPSTLKGILKKIKELGEVLHRKKAAARLISQLESYLRKVKKLPYTPGVVYEVMSNPLLVAGTKSIVNDIIEKAGGKNLITVPRKHIAVSPEKVLALNPDFYIYQVGPMNRHPIPPKQRPYFKDLKAVVIRVKEKDFARPGLNAFKAVVKLNRIFYQVLAGKRQRVRNYGS